MIHSKVPKFVDNTDVNLLVATNHIELMAIVLNTTSAYIPTEMLQHENALQANVAYQIATNLFTQTDIVIYIIIVGRPMAILSLQERKLYVQLMVVMGNITRMVIAQNTIEIIYDTVILFMRTKRKEPLAQSTGVTGSIPLKGFVGSITLFTNAIKL